MKPKKENAPINALPVEGAPNRRNFLSAVSAGLFAIVPSAEASADAGESRAEPEQQISVHMQRFYQSARF